jgi:hypothetical protein
MRSDRQPGLRVTEMRVISNLSLYDRVVCGAPPNYGDGSQNSRLSNLFTTKVSKQSCRVRRALGADGDCHLRVVQPKISVYYYPTERAALPAPSTTGVLHSSPS